jgi:hypothetical protein
MNNNGIHLAVMYPLFARLIACASFYVESWFNCCNISSAAFTTREFDS